MFLGGYWLFMTIPSPWNKSFWIILNHFVRFSRLNHLWGYLSRSLRIWKIWKKKGLPEVLRDVDTKGLPMGGTVFGLTGPAATRGGKVRCGIGTLVVRFVSETWEPRSVVLGLSLPQSVHDENHEGRACAVWKMHQCGIAWFFVVSTFECLSLLIPQILLNHKPQWQYCKRPTHRD